MKLWKQARRWIIEKLARRWWEAVRSVYYATPLESWDELDSTVQDSVRRKMRAFLLGRRWEP